eukprot:scaffold147727_cov31-Prasinocladus_malaysianus.AAC.1
MAVYSSARLTLAIRTKESNGNRYHQRAWTFQEFCVCRHLHLVTEPPGDEESEEAAATAAEHRLMVNIRAGYQNLSSADVLPLWLKAGAANTFTQDEAKAVLTKFRDLDASLSCAFWGDKIRALCPLLAKTPVESAGDLMKLVVQLSKASGENLQMWEDALFDQYLTQTLQNPLETLMMGIEADLPARSGGDGATSSASAGPGVEAVNPVANAWEDPNAPSSNSSSLRKPRRDRGPRVAKTLSNLNARMMYADATRSQDFSQRSGGSRSTNTVRLKQLRKNVGIFISNFDYGLKMNDCYHACELYLA